MGATLGHLCILDVNFTLKQCSSFHSSIDYSVSNPVAKSFELVPIERIEKDQKWNDTDIWCRYVWIPCVSQPEGFGVTYETFTNYTVEPFTLNYPSSGLYGDMKDTPGSSIGLTTPLRIKHKQNNEEIHLTLQDVLNEEQFSEITFIA